MTLVEGTKAPVYPVFLVIPQVSTRFAAIPATVAPLETVLRTTQIFGVDLYYRTNTDMALLALRLDTRLATAQLVDELNIAAAQTGTAILDANRLPDGARRRFYDSYLPLYDVCLGSLGAPGHALEVLERHLTGLAVASTPPHGVPVLNAADRLEVRFRRGDAWQLARVRNMTRDGISIATGTPPHRNDIVDLELIARGVSLIVRSSVVGVASGDTASALGATGFGARFIIAGETERKRLEQLLDIVTEQQSLEPPPRRRDARYPVRWPVFLRTPKVKVSLRALDMSRHGMFVGADGEIAPAEGPVHVTLPIDDRGTPILATARVARAIPDTIARTRGLSPGVGLELLALSSHDERRFAQFVARISRRAEREVVVGAGSERLAELTAALVGAGYTATGVSGAVELTARTTSAARLPDLVVIDSSLSSEDPRGLSAARRALAVRAVPTLSIDGDSPGAAREWVDDALLA